MYLYRMSLAVFWSCHSLWDGSSQHQLHNMWIVHSYVQCGGGDITLIAEGGAGVALSTGGLLRRQSANPSATWSWSDGCRRLGAPWSDPPPCPHATILRRRCYRGGPEALAVLLTRALDRVPSLVPRPKQPQRGSLAVSRARYCKRSALGVFGSGNETNCTRWSSCRCIPAHLAIPPA